MNIMKMRHALLVPFLLLPVLAWTYDLKLTVRIKETGEKILDVPMTAWTPGFAASFRGEPNAPDTTFLFKGLPESKITITFNDLNGNVMGEEIPTPVDTMTILIPVAMLPHKLQEVVVNSDSRFFNGDKAVYIPDRKEKRVSRDGTSLLRNMAIPTIDVSGMDGAVRTSSGEPVSLFIDYLPASQQEVAAIRTMDVAKVEVLDFPSDPRFNGAQHAVNFIMTRYVYGGYTKADATQRLVFGVGNYRAYSKLTSGSMTYSAGAGYSFHGSHRYGKEGVYRYSFPEDAVTADRHYSEKISNRSGDGFLKAVYAGGKAVISNIIGITYNRTPGNRQSIAEIFDSPSYVSGTAEHNSSGRSASVTWNGNYRLTLPHSLTLVVEPRASTGRFRNSATYSTEGEEILNKSHDRAWSAGYSSDLTRQLGRHSVTLGTGVSYSHNDIDYGGTTPATVGYSAFLGGIGVSASVRLGNLTLSPSVSVQYSMNKTGETKIRELHPKFFMRGIYSPGSRTRLRFLSEYGQMTVPPDMRGDNIQMRDQIHVSRGNPSVKSQLYCRALAGLTWFASRAFSLAGDATWYRSWRNLATAYEPVVIDGRHYMLSTLRTGGNGFTNRYDLSLSPSLRIPGNGLNMKATLLYTWLSNHGPMRWRGGYASFTAQAGYTLSDFYFSAYYSSRTKNVEYNWRTITPAYLALTAGWSNGNLNVSCSAMNPFTSSYFRQRTVVDTENFGSDVTHRSPAYHRSFQISLTYSFSYGKKVSRNGEESTPQGVKTGVLSL